jgi:hypothetical protein
MQENLKSFLQERYTQNTLYKMYKVHHVYYDINWERLENIAYRRDT